MKICFISKGSKRTYNSFDEVPFEARGVTFDRTIERVRGDIVPRKELDNLPVFYGFLGPMWDGDSIRYETQEVYDMLSE